MTNENIVAILAKPSNESRELHSELAGIGLQTIIVHSSEELHSLLTQQSVDAVVLENQLGGFFTGLEIIDRLRQQLGRPITVLIGSLTAEERTRAANLKIDFVTEWNAGITSIRDSIRAAVLAATVIRIPAAARRAVTNTDFIRPMPQLVVRMAGYLSDERASTADLAKDISTDARLTADVLRMVNSAAFGTRNRVVRVADAVSLLGIRRIASVVVAAAVEGIQTEFEKHLGEDLMQWYRSRSLVMASAAASFAKLAPHVSRDQMYVLGLLQDLGVLVLAHRFGRRHLHLIDRCRSLAALSLDVCERQELSFTHADVSAALVQKWDLPTSMVNLVLKHHDDSNESTVASVDSAMLHLMRVGESLSNMIDVPSPQRNSRLQRLLRAYPDATPETIKTCMAEAVATATEMKKLFAVPVPIGDEWNQVVDQIDSQLQSPSEEAGIDDNPGG